MQALEKILGEIDKLEDPYYKDYVDRKNVVEIIRSHMNDEDNNGWIPVEDGLPEEKEGAIRTFKQLMKSLYLVTDGRGVIIALFDDGHFIDVDDYIPYEKVIAWRPLPEPYKPKKLQTEEKPVQ